MADVVRHDATPAADAAPTADPALDLRVVVVTWQPGAHLADFVASLATAAAAPVAVTVVDNGSTDGTVEWVERRVEPASGRLTLVETGANLGYGGGANVGLRHAHERWVVVANPDLTFAPGALDELAAVAARWPDAGVLGPRILTTEGDIYPSARDLPSLGRGIGHAVFGWVWPTNPWTASYRRERGAPREEAVGWLSGACLFLRRDVVEAVGGFDERYFMYFEDVDLCDRIGRAGYDVVYAPSAVVQHHGGVSTAKAAAAMAKAHHESAYRYLSSRYDAPYQLPLRLVLRLGLGARRLVAARVSRVRHGAAPTRRA